MTADVVAQMQLTATSALPTGAKSTFPKWNGVQSSLPIWVHLLEAYKLDPFFLSVASW